MSSERREQAAAWTSTATIVESIAVFATVELPLIAKGVIIRRPRMVGLAERFDLDRRAVQRLQRLRARHGRGPLRIRIPFRTAIVVLDRQHARRVLEESPEPFEMASPEKRAALSHFQPHGVLATRRPRRDELRRVNEEALDHPTPVHRDGDELAAAVRAEAEELAGRVARTGHLDWDAYVHHWTQMVRRVVLGEQARHDEQVTDDLARLRRDANWAFARPKRSRTRERFLRHVETYVQRAERPSLVAALADVATPEDEVRHEQVPQWLFAFDAACWASFRALALLVGHPEVMGRARAEIELAGRRTPGNGSTRTGVPTLPVLRASMLESLRLWPTTPAILRSTTEDTEWEPGTLPAGSSVLVYAPLLHRDDEQLPFAHRFAPDVWLDGDAPDVFTLVPFSAGPGECPGQNVVLLSASTFLATLLEHTALQLDDPDRLRGPLGLPGTLDPFTLRFVTNVG